MAFPHPEGSGDLTVNLDVAVIGASSAGLYAAEQLARAGKHVAVFEKQQALEPARRTLIITPALQQVLGPMPEAIVLHRTSIMSVSTLQEHVRITLDEPDLIVERGSLARLLAQRATAAGAEIYYGHQFERAEPAKHGALIRLRRPNGEVVTATARDLVGADGFRGKVAPAAGLGYPPSVPIIQAEVCLPAGWDPAVTLVWFDASHTRYFYWLIPDSAQ